MIIDPIVEQIHKRRQEYMERFRYDYDAVVRDIREHETATAGPLVQPPEAPPAGHSARRSRTAGR